MRYNALVLSYQPSLISSLLLNIPQIAAVEETDSGSAAISMLQIGRFDLLFLHDILPGYDGLSFLNHIRSAKMTTLPRTIYISSFDDPKWIHIALSQGADSVIWGLIDQKQLSDAISAAFSCPYPHIGEETLTQRQTISANLLQRIGMSKALKGFRLLTQGIAWLSYTDKTNFSLKESVYQQLASFNKTTLASVERNIRTAIDNAWLKGDLEQIQVLFGYSVDANRGKPTNAEVLFMLREHVRRELHHTSFV